MKLDVSEQDGIHVLRFTGNLDGRSSPAAQHAMLELIERGATRLLIDLEEVTLISSAGLRVLLMAAKRMDGVGGSLRACSANATVLEVMRITGFDSIIPVRDSSEAALQELSG